MNSFASVPTVAPATWNAAASDSATLARDEARRARNYPISRWYVHPLAGFVSRYLARSALRPWHVTLFGFGCTLAAVATTVLAPAETTVAALLIFAAWFSDRLDGQLARRQGTASRYGAWLDANLDELSDLALHAAFAAAAAAQIGSLAWWLWGGFVSGKYLFMYGLETEQANESVETQAIEPQGWPARLYHLPANADVRIHLAMAAAYFGAWGIELGAIAAYYQLRWLARYFLVAARLREEAL